MDKREQGPFLKARKFSRIPGSNRTKILHAQFPSIEFIRAPPASLSQTFFNSADYKLKRARMQTALTMSTLCQPRGIVVKSPSQQKASVIRGARFVVRAEAAEAKVWSAPALNPNTPSPIFGGSTGTLKYCFVPPRRGNTYF